MQLLTSNKWPFAPSTLTRQEDQETVAEEEEAVETTTVEVEAEVEVRRISRRIQHPSLRIDASGRVDQGFGPVGGAAAAADADFDIFGIDDPSTFQTQPQPASQQPILYVPSLFFSYFWSFV